MTSAGQAGTARKTHARTFEQPTSAAKRRKIAGSLASSPSPAVCTSALPTAVAVLDVASTAPGSCYPRPGPPADDDASVAASGTPVVRLDVNMTESAAVSPSPCSQSPLDIIKRDSPVPPPFPTVSVGGLQRSLAALDAASHAVRLRASAEERADKGTSDAYARRVRDYTAWWDVYQCQLRDEDATGTWTMIPAFPVTAAKAAMFLDHEVTREKVSVITPLSGPSSPPTDLDTAPHSTSRAPARPSPDRMSASPSSSKSSAPWKTGGPETITSTLMSPRLKCGCGTTAASGPLNRERNTMSRSASTARRCSRLPGHLTVRTAPAQIQ